MNKLSAIIPAAFFPHIRTGAQQRGWNNVQIAHFVSQCGHESAGFTRLEENLNYTAAGLRRVWPSRFTEAQAKAMARQPQRIANHVYGGRLGNTQPNDGWHFRGRGILQVTGRANYRECTEALFKDMRLLTNPELLLIPEHAVASAFWYWDKNRIANITRITPTLEVESVTRRVNGGLIGLDDRRKRFNQALNLLK